MINAKVQVASHRELIPDIWQSASAYDTLYMKRNLALIDMYDTSHCFGRITVYLFKNCYLQINDSICPVYCKAIVA